MKKRLSTNSYKGTKDYYPEDLTIRNLIFDVWRSTAYELGYEEYDTPIIEDLNLYRAKSSEEIANKQLYTFVDKGGREIALRPEMTPSLARIVAAKVKELPKPIRWFNIGRFYRYEKPQKGRTREFFQLNIDILGVSKITAEIEIFLFINNVMEKLNAPKNSYCIYFNNRKWINYLFNELLHLDEKEKSVLKSILDNYMKLSKKEFVKNLKECNLSDEKIEIIFKFLNYKIEDLIQFQKVSEGAKEILELYKKLVELRVKNIQFKPSIIRGFDYYTGTVLELYDVGSTENPRALCGGGRYDNLLEIFGEKKIPAFGLGWGDITFTDYIETYNLYSKGNSRTDVFATLMDEKFLNKTTILCQELRDAGINVEQQLTSMSLSKQFSYADKKNIPWVIVIGDEEDKNGLIRIKNLESGKQYRMGFKEILRLIKG